jgi:Predicted ATPase (AAA+ superfamily)
MEEMSFLVDLIYYQNPWLKELGAFPREKFLPKRDFYYQFKKLVFETKQISALTGVRRVGKTVILKQLLAEILETKTTPPFYFSFDQEIIFKAKKTPLSLVIDFYLKNILKKSPHQIKQPVYLFFDEIQLVPFWQDILKRYYDLNQNFKFIVSGSSSLFLKEESKESLAGRIVEMTLPPLTFLEYQKLKKSNLENPIFDFEDYLKYGGFFELIELSFFDKKKEFLNEWILGKVLERDLPLMFKVFDQRIFRILFNIFLQTTSQVIFLNKIAAELGLSTTTIGNYLNFLEKSLLLKTSFNLAGSFVRRERRLRKVYPASPSFISILPNFSLPAMAETYVFNFFYQVLKKEIFFFKKRYLEIDFIDPVDKILIEVKYQNKIHKDDYKSLLLLMKKNKYAKAFILTKDTQGKEIIDEKEIVLLPVYQLESFFKKK